MDAYGAIVDKRDQRAFLPKPPSDDALRRILKIPADVHVNRVIAFGYVDPARASAPKSVARPRKALDELVHWETW